MNRLQLIAAFAMLSAVAAASPVRAQEGLAIPSPAVDEQAKPGATEVAVFAGGCFWGVQGVFQHVEGVKNAVSGYAGGDKSTAVYETVGTGTTGHAESVKITYDPAKVTYGKLMQIYFSVAHDPTQLNYQGPDHGTQYRSAIFPQNEEQAKLASSYIAQLDAAKIYHAPIVTKIEPGKAFYPAEDYHQDFLTLHPTYPYIFINDIPKVRRLQRLYPEVFRQKPALVSEAKVTE